MKNIKLAGNNSLYTIVDNEDFDRFAHLKWHLSSHGYAVHNISRGKIVYLHRLIINASKGINTDHVNGNTLDNRSRNLRLCNQSQNGANKRISSNNTSGYKGVYWSKQRNKWHAKVVFENQQFHAGSFDSKEEAAQAYLKKASELFGEFARAAKT